jgi:hypothetical protein
MFAEGASNSIAVNLNAVTQLKWNASSQKLKESLQKAAQNNKKYNFQVFDLSTGYHTTITAAKPEKIHGGEGSVAKLVMQELFNQRKELMELMA